MKSNTTQILEVLCEETKQAEEFHIHINKSIEQKRDQIAELFCNMMFQFSDWSIIMLQTVQMFLEDKSIPEDFREKYIQALQQIDKMDTTDNENKELSKNDINHQQILNSFNFFTGDLSKKIVS